MVSHSGVDADPGNLCFPWAVDPVTSYDVQLESEMRTKSQVELPPITRILGSNSMSPLGRRTDFGTARASMAAYRRHMVASQGCLSRGRPAGR